MQKLTCKHCGGEIDASDTVCTHCGIPLPPDMGKSTKKRFTRYFIALIIFCVVMIIWLPPDWTRFIK